MLQDLTILLCIIIFIICNLIVHKGKISLARGVVTIGAVTVGVLGLLYKMMSPFILFLGLLVCMGIMLIGMYYIPSSENYDEAKTQAHKKFFKRGLYSWLFLVALYIYLYVLTYY